MMLIGLLKRVLGTSDEHKAADERYKRRVADLEEREKELDALGEQVRGVTAMQKAKNGELRKTGIDLTATINQTLPPGTKGIEDDDQEDEERLSGEAFPSVG